MKKNRLLALSLSFNLWIVLLYTYGLKTIQWSLYGNLFDLKIAFEIFAMLENSQLLTFVMFTLVLLLAYIIEKVIK